MPVLTILPPNLVATLLKMVEMVAMMLKMAAKVFGFAHFRRSCCKTGDILLGSLNHMKRDCTSPSC
jgi:hypothetical protein